MTLLRAGALRRTFGGVTALDGVDVEIAHGEIGGIIGPNGSGKTTLFDCITGWCRPDSGDLLLEGRPITGLSPHRIARLGIGRTFQTGRLFPNLSVLENILVGGWQRQRGRGHRARASETTELGLAHLRRLGLAHFADQPAGTLSYGQRKLVEVAQVLVGDPKLVLLDEPTAGVNAQNVDVLAGLLVDLRDNGQSVLIIEHETSSVTSLLDHVVVLDRGRIVARGAASEIESGASVLERHLGV